jgi:hypothetical protein
MTSIESGNTGSPRRIVSGGRSEEQRPIFRGQARHGVLLRSEVTRECVYPEEDLRDKAIEYMYGEIGITQPDSVADQPDTDIL